LSNFTVEFFKNGEWYYRYDVEHLEISNDYLYQSKLQIPFKFDKEILSVIPDFDLIGACCAVVDDKNTQYFVGFVNDWSEDDILIENIARSLDFDIEPMSKTTASIESELMLMCKAQYSTNPDNLQNIDYIVFLSDTYTEGVINTTEVTKFTDFLVEVLKRHQIVMTTQLNLNYGSVSVTFKKASTSLIEIKTDIILEIKIISEASWVTNKIKYYNATSTLLGTYFLLANNTISTQITNPLRLSPVNESKKIVDETQTDFNLDEIANQDLKGNVYAQEIEFSMSTEDNLISVTDLKIGTKIKIYTDRREILTIITGVALDASTKIAVIKCGMLRSDLSKLLYNKLK
jgi:hypothetical protein